WDGFKLVVLEGSRSYCCHDRLENIDINYLPLARSFAVKQCHSNRTGSGNPADTIGEPEGRQRRRAVSGASEIRESTHCFGDRAETCALRVGPGLPEPRQPQHDKSRVLFAELLGCYSPSFQCSRSKILDNHVCCVREPSKNVAAFRRREIQCYA